jgi:hypothetical protein
VALVEILARAGLVGVVSVDGHVAAVDVVHAVGLVGRPDQLLDAVALADVSHQLDQGAVRCIGDSVGVLGVAGDFDGDGAVVVLTAGSAPGAILLVDGQTDAAVFADDVIGAALSVSGGKIVAALLGRPLAHDAVDRDGVDGVVARAGLVLGDVGISHQRAVAHGAGLLTGVFRLCLVLSVLLPGEDGLVVLPELDGLPCGSVGLGDSGDITTQIHLVRARREIELLRARLLGAPDGFVGQFHCLASSTMAWMAAMVSSMWLRRLWTSLRLRFLLDASMAQVCTLSGAVASVSSIRKLFICLAVFFLIASPTLGLVLTGRRLATA